MFHNRRSLDQPKIILSYLYRAPKLIKNNLLTGIDHANRYQTVFTMNIFHGKPFENYFPNELRRKSYFISDLVVKT